VITHYGNVSSSGTRRAFTAFPRFVALVDVLGMKHWVAKVGPQVPAGELDDLMRVARDAASGNQIGEDGTTTPLGTSLCQHALAPWAREIDAAEGSRHPLGSLLLEGRSCARPRRDPFKGASRW